MRYIKKFEQENYRGKYWEIYLNDPLRFLTILDKIGYDFENDDASIMSIINNFERFRDQFIYMAKSKSFIANRYFWNFSFDQYTFAFLYEKMEFEVSEKDIEEYKLKIDVKKYNL